MRKYQNWVQLQTRGWQEIVIPVLQKSTSLNITSFQLILQWGKDKGMQFTLE
jgi:hypothetical protein